MLLNDPQGFSFKCHSRMSKGIKILWLEIDHRVKGGVAILDI